MRNYIATSSSVVRRWFTVAHRITKVQTADRNIWLMEQLKGVVQIIKVLIITKCGCALVVDVVTERQFENDELENICIIVLKCERSLFLYGTEDLNYAIFNKQ